MKKVLSFCLEQTKMRTKKVSVTAKQLKILVRDFGAVGKIYGWCALQKTKDHSTGITVSAVVVNGKQMATKLIQVYCSRLCRA